MPINDDDTDNKNKPANPSATAAATVPSLNKIRDYDDFVEQVGEFGLWQKFICLLLWFPAAAGGIHVLMYSFTGLSPDKYRSDYPDNSDRLSAGQ